MKYLKNDKVQTTTFTSIREIIEDMIETTLNSEEGYGRVTLVAKIELIEKILKMFSATEVNGFEISYSLISIDTLEYDDLYYLTFDNDGKIWVEKAWHNDNRWHKAGYLYTESDLMYVFSDDINDEIMEEIDNNNILVFDID